MTDQQSLRNFVNGEYVESKDEKVERLLAFAESRGRTLLELALSWLAAAGQSQPCQRPRGRRFS